MKLSIIIPVYNIEKYLPKCLDSLLDQDLSTEQYEILVIDDGSTDDSPKIAQSYSKRFDNIHSIQKKNGGVGSARNKGLELATGKYVYFIDPDDYLAPNVLNAIIETCEKHQLEVLTFASQKLTDHSLYDSMTKNDQLSISKICNGYDYIGNQGYQNEVWWYVIKKELIENIGLSFIEGRWLEDAIFTTRLFLKAKNMAHLPIDAHRYMEFPNSAMRSKEPKHYLGVIDDLQHVAVIFKAIIDDAQQSTSNESCLKRLKARQQSFVFFMMYRMMWSTIKLKGIKLTLKKMKRAGAYPMNNFLGKDYNGVDYFIAVQVFNKKWLFYLSFIVFNPIFKFISYCSTPRKTEVATLAPQNSIQ